MAEKKTWGVAIISFNNEKTLKMVLNSVERADSVVVVDSGSTDGTEEICKSFGANFIEKKWTGYSDQKQFSIDQLETDWVLSLDSDEVLSDELVIEIEKTIESKDPENGFEIPRLMVFMGKKLAHGKGVDYPLRLFKKNHGKLDGRKIHEKILVNGKVGQLGNPMFHYSTDGISERIVKIWRDVISEKDYSSEMKLNPLDPIWIPIKYFMAQTILNESWKDGLPGIINVGFYSLQHFLHRSAVFWWKIKK